MADNAKHESGTLPKDEQESGTLPKDGVTVPDDSEYAVTTIKSASEDKAMGGVATFSTHSASSEADMVEIRIDESPAKNVADMPSGMHPTSSSTVTNKSSDVRYSVSLNPVEHVPLSSPFPSIVSSFRVSAFNAIKRTRQTLSEKIGHGTKTVDVELNARVESLQLLQKRYANMIQLARSFTVHFSNVVSCQQALEAEFNYLSQKLPELHSEFAYNAETQKILHKNGEILVGVVSFFISNLDTLCSKTIEDTLFTVKQYEEARLEFDAYRIDYESNKSSASEQSYLESRQKFEQIRQILDVKLKLLDENKVKVLHQQLVLFHNAISAYFSGNQTALEDTVKQFSIKLKSPNASFLENQN